MTGETAERGELEKAAAAAERAGQWEHAVELFGELFRCAVEGRDRETLHHSLSRLVLAFWNLGRLEEAQELAELAHEVARRTGHRHAEADSLNRRAAVLHARQRFPEADALYRRALEKARDLGDDALVAKVCLNLGVIEHTVGDLREARALYLESVSAGLRSGLPEHAVNAYNNLGMVCTDLGEWLEAQMHLDRGIEIAERLGDTSRLAFLRANLTEPLIHLNEIRAAKSQTEVAESLAHRTSNHTVLIDVARFRSMIAMTEGRLPDAESELRRGLAMAEEHGLDLCRAETLEQLARLRRRQGRMPEAVEALENAFDTFFGLGAKRDVRRVAPLLEEWRESERARVRIGRSAPS